MSHLKGRNQLPQSPGFSTSMDSGTVSVLSLPLGTHPGCGSGVRREIARYSWQICVHPFPPLLSEPSQWSGKHPDCRHGSDLKGRVQHSLQSPLESSPVPPLSKGLTPPEQVLLFLPGLIRELELLQPLRRSTSFSPLWIRFKAEPCTHPGPGLGCLAAAGWGSISLEGGQPAIPS